MAQSKIRLLPESLIDQIAAGEVVERPASVVKELVENALDAGATSIRVDIELGGRGRIRIVDNGSGMPAADALLAIQRHATSKLAEFDDLSRIRTLGFRGEALASIRSVSRFSLSTRDENAIVGTRVRCDGPSEPRVDEIAMNRGTAIDVIELFYNVPARLKFLKKERTEQGRIAEIVQRFALGYPSVHFSLRHNGKVVADYPPESDLTQRLAAIFGRKIAKRMVPIQLTLGVSVEGLISEPTLTKSNNSGIFTFINRRFVRDRVVQRALQNAYGSLLERNRLPYAVLQLSVAPNELDVNVHPMKREVRFANSGAVYQAVYRAAQSTLSESPWLPAASPKPYNTETGGSANIAEASRFQYDSRQYTERPGNAYQEPLPLTSSDGEPVSSGFFSSLRYIGQALDCYLICESDEALQIIDQHAAHERVTYEKLRAQFQHEQVARQRLLFPITVELTLRELEALQTHQPAFARLGFDVAHFGPGTVAIKEVPALLVDSDPEALVRDLLYDVLAYGRSQVLTDRYDALLSRMACHRSIRGGDSVSLEEVRRLFAELDSVDFSGNCPHGRPVLVSMKLSELLSRFKRS